MDIKVNDAITATKICLIDHNGKRVGITTLEEGIELAKRQALDLVEISAKTTPPVCKVLDFAKYKYNLRKKAKQAKRKQKNIGIKEIKLRYNIAIGDFNIKLNNAKRFINDNNKVKVTLFFRGREITHEEVGINLLERFKTEALNFAKVEADMKREGKQVSMVIGPK